MRRALATVLPLLAAAAVLTGTASADPLADPPVPPVASTDTTVLPRLVPATPGQRAELVKLCIATLETRPAPTGAAAPVLEVAALCQRQVPPCPPPKCCTPGTIPAAPPVRQAPAPTVADSGPVVTH